MSGGLWGEPTSTVDWCERNYDHLSSVAELFNTGSSFAIVVAGILGLLLHRGALERRFLVPFALLSLVGLGSVAFHGTLRFELQMLDELPMLYLVIWMVFILVEDGPTRKHGLWFPLFLAVYAAVLTYLCAFTRGRLQFTAFQIGFTALELFCLTRVWMLHRRSTSAPARRLFRRGMTAYALAVTAWLTDTFACEWVGTRLPAAGLFNPQLHAWWHVLVSVGFYSLLLVIACHHLERMGRGYEVHRKLGFVAALRPSVLGAGLYLVALHGA